MLASAPLARVAQAQEQEEDAPPAWESAEEDTTASAPAAPKLRTPRTVASEAPADAQLRGADVDLEHWDQELSQVQRETRAYLGSWVVGMTALMSFNLYTAMTAESEARRGGFTVASALSGANFLYLLVQGWPALGSHKRFRNMPSGTIQEKVAKATYAQEVIAAQRHKDHLVATIERHIGAFVVGLGAGLGIGLGYGDLYEGLSLGVGVVGVAELLILTRPGNYHSPEKRPTFSLRNVHVSPWADQYARGIGVVGQF
jgi:hypothetical protein